MRTYLIAIFVIVLLASPAAASNKWFRTVAGSSEISSLGTSEVAYFQVTETSTTDSKILDVSGCSSWTAVVVNSSGGIATGFFMSSLTSDGSLGLETGKRVGVAANSAKVLNSTGDSALTGDEATGLAWLYNVVGVPFPWFDTVVAPGAGETFTVMVSCSGSW